MIVGNILGWDSGQDDLFNPLSKRNRDDCLHPFRVLNSYAQQNGIALHTPDVNAQLGLRPSFNLLLESVEPIPNQKNYLIRFESEIIVPKNGDINYLEKFNLIFTWQDNLVDNKKYIKICCPNSVATSAKFGFGFRPIFACMIAGNKYAAKSDGRELYSERVKAIQWFEKNHPDDFFLYGMGWDKPAKAQSGVSKVIYKVNRLRTRAFGLKPFPSYRGSLETKRDILEQARFSLCYENVRDLPGYVTEKIFDCFFSGCVPIYWGADEIGELIPQNCFIDKRKFNDMESLYAYLKNMPEDDYIDKQKNIQDFLSSNSFKPFSSESFAQIIILNIKRDLKEH